MKKWSVLSALFVGLAVVWGGHVCAQAQSDLKAMLNPAPGIYVSAWPGFTVSYPKEWIVLPLEGVPEFRVGAPRPALPPSPGFEVTVGPPSGPLDKEAGSLAAFFGKLPFAKDVKVVSDKPAQLKDGTPAREVELEWVYAPAGVKINILFLVTRKDDVGIWVDIAHDQGKIADDLKNILYSLKFQPATQGMVKMPPDVEQFLTDWGSAVGSRNVDKVMTHFSDQYLQYGRNKQGMAQGWTYVFTVLAPNITFSKVSVTGFTLDGDKAYVTGFSTDDNGKHPMASPEVMIKENGQWKWYGNQVAGYGAPNPSTATSAKFTLATSIEEIAGTWFTDKCFASSCYLRFDKDGTSRQAGTLDLLDKQPWAINSHEFKGAEMRVTEVSVNGVPSSGKVIGRYQVQLLEGGNIRIVVIDDPSPRSGGLPAEYGPVR